MTVQPLVVCLVLCLTVGAAWLPVRLSDLRSLFSLTAVYLPDHPSILTRALLFVQPRLVVIFDRSPAHGTNSGKTEGKNPFTRIFNSFFLVYFFLSRCVSLARYLFWTVCPSSLSVTEGE